jgi:hypothetical protein
VMRTAIPKSADMTALIAKSALYGAKATTLMMVNVKTPVMLLLATMMESTAIVQKAAIDPGYLMLSATLNVIMRHVNGTEVTAPNFQLQSYVSVTQKISVTTNVMRTVTLVHATSMEAIVMSALTVVKMLC